MTRKSEQNKSTGAKLETAVHVNLKGPGHKMNPRERGKLLRSHSALSLSKRSISDPIGKAPAGYGKLLQDLKARIRSAQLKAALSVNRELIELYWHIGKSIVKRQRVEGWGKAIVERLATDLQSEFPGIAGFSAGNIWRMRAFYLAWTKEVLAQPARESGRVKLAQVARELDGHNLPKAAATIPWFHNVILVERLKNPAERL
jgi:hypothetical protein